jgi:hypothetical protein
VRPRGTLSCPDVCGAPRLQPALAKLWSCERPPCDARHSDSPKKMVCCRCWRAFRSFMEAVHGQPRRSYRLRRQLPELAQRRIFASRRGRGGLDRAVCLRTRLLSSPWGGIGGCVRALPANCRGDRWSTSNRGLTADWPIKARRSMKPRGFHAAIASAPIRFTRPRSRRRWNHDPLTKTPHLIALSEFHPVICTLPDTGLRSPRRRPGWQRSARRRTVARNGPSLRLPVRHGALTAAKPHLRGSKQGYFTPLAACSIRAATAFGTAAPAPLIALGTIVGPVPRARQQAKSR